MKSEWKLPQITDAAMAERLEAQLRMMRQQIKEMTLLGPGPRRLLSHHRAIIASARNNAAQLAKHIREWKSDQPKPKRRRPEGKRPARRRAKDRPGRVQTGAAG